MVKKLGENAPVYENIKRVISYQEAEQPNREVTGQNIIFRKQVDTVANAKEVSNLLEIVREISAALYKLKLFSERLSKEQSEYDKADQELLHNLESASVITEQQAIELVRKNAESRTNRRNIKTLSTVANWIYANTPKNLEQMVYNAINKKNYINEYNAQKYKKNEWGIK